jgi:murein DD-endopeptidase MepM/ murein hydrolase activator NlpD
MDKKITLYAYSHAGKPMRQKTLSYKAIWAIGVSMIFLLVAAGLAGYDYYGLKKNQRQACQLSEKIKVQSEEITHQRKNIQRYAADLNYIKNKLAQLTALERQIRIIANLENNDNQEGVFGVGGPFPEDLDASVELTQTHNSLIREMHDRAGLLADVADKKTASLPVLLEKLEKQRNLLVATPSIWPAKGWLASSFGRRESPFSKRREFHKGIDVSAPKGTPVYATANGTVTFAGRKGSLGKIIVIEHGHGFTTRYAHNHKLLKKKGETVKRGDKIALVGNTGRSTGPHVHYEVHINGMPVNPLNYILR